MRRITLEQHQETGEVLAKVRFVLSDQLGRLAPQLLRHDRAYNRLLAAVDKLDAARALLDDRLAADHPDRYDSGIYYPRSLG